MPMIRRLTTVSVLFAAAFSAGCADPIPKGNYYESQAEWDVLVKKWNKKYEYGCTYVPRRPKVEQFVSEKLRKATPTRVSILGAFANKADIEPGPWGYGHAGRLVELRCRTAQFLTLPPQPAARDLDCATFVQDKLERELANSAKFAIVDRGSLKLVLNERDLRKVFSTPAEVSSLGAIESADAILIAQASSLKYPIYSQPKEPKEKDKAYTMYNAYWARVSVRMIDVASGTLLWSAVCEYDFGNQIMVPVVVHPEACDDLPDALCIAPGDWSLEACVHYLVRCLLWSMNGKPGVPPDSERLQASPHAARSWVQK